LLGPSATSIMAATAGIGGFTQRLSFYSAPTLTPINVVAGQTYFFAASTVGSPGTGFLNVGGHTVNTGPIVDNGRFWYSNSLGNTFDGKALVPEMAFSVTISDTPKVPDTGSTIVFLTFALCAVVALREGLKIRLAY